MHKPLAKLNQARLGIEQETPYINSGVMLLNLPLFREHLDLAEIRAFANKKKSILFLPDQDILTALYGDHVKLLDSLRYNLSDRVLAFHNAKSQQERLDVEWVRKTVSSSITAESQSLGRSITTAPSAYFIKNWLNIQIAG